MKKAYLLAALLLVLLAAATAAAWSQASDIGSGIGWLTRQAWYVLR